MFFKIQNRLFKGCIADWKLENEENMKKVVSPLGQIPLVEDTKSIKGSVTLTNQSELVQAICYEDEIETLFTEKILQQQAGVLGQTATFTFQSKEKKLPQTSILSLKQKVHLRTFLALSFIRKRDTNITQYNIAYIAPNHLEPQPVKIEVGAENALQVEISVPNSNVDILNGILYANVHFVTAQKKMKEMKVYIKRREGVQDKYISEWQELYGMQTMDGAPFRNEVIPIRIQMNKINDIGCSYDSATIKIQYVIFVSVIDIDDQNYFKEVPLTLYCEKQQEDDEESSEEQQKTKKSKKSKK